MRKWMLATLLIISSGCAHVDDWTRADTKLFVTYAVTGALDTRSTQRFQYHDDLVELNPLVVSTLGENPRTSSLWQGYLVAAVGNYFIARALPAKWRSRYLKTWAVSHGSLFLSNCNELNRRDDTCL